MSSSAQNSVSGFYEIGQKISNRLYFDKLRDTPTGYLGHSGDYLAVNYNESGIHFTGIEKIAQDLTDYGFSVGAADLNSFDFDGNAIFGFDASISDVSNTSYTLSSSDLGKLISIEHSSSITITIPLGIASGFNCSFLQKGSGSLEFSAANGVTLSNRQSYTKTAGQYAMATLIAHETNKFVLIGDLS